MDPCVSDFNFSVDLRKLGRVFAHLDFQLHKELPLQFELGRYEVGHLGTYPVIWGECFRTLRSVKRKGYHTHINVIHSSPGEILGVNRTLVRPV